MNKKRVRGKINLAQQKKVREQFNKKLMDSLNLMMIATFFFPFLCFPTRKKKIH